MKITELAVITSIKLSQAHQSKAKKGTVLESLFAKTTIIQNSFFFSFLSKQTRKLLSPNCHQ